MPVLTKGTTYSNGTQVTAANLNALVDSATFASGAVDDVTTQLSGGSIIVKDGGISAAKLASNSVTTAKITDANVTPAKLSSGGPSWTSTSFAVDTNVLYVDYTNNRVGIGNTSPSVALGVTGDITATGVVTAGTNLVATTKIVVNGAELQPSTSGNLYPARAVVCFDATRNAAGTTDSSNTARYLYSSYGVISVTKVASGQFAVKLTFPPAGAIIALCNTVNGTDPRFAGADVTSLSGDTFNVYVQNGSFGAANYTQNTVVVYS